MNVQVLTESTVFMMSVKEDTILDYGRRLPTVSIVYRLLQ